MNEVFEGLFDIIPYSMNSLSFAHLTLGFLVFSLIFFFFKEALCVLETFVD